MGFSLYEHEAQLRLLVTIIRYTFERCRVGNELVSGSIMHPKLPIIDGRMLNVF